MKKKTVNKHLHILVSERTRGLIDRLTQKHDTSITHVVQQAVRQMADRDGITLPADTPTPAPSTTTTARAADTVGALGAGKEKE